MRLLPSVKQDLEDVASCYFEGKLYSIACDEVKMLLAIHKNINNLEYHWNRILPPGGPKISMNAYFIHLTPQVLYSGLSGKGIEFGDVLYLYTETDNKNYTRETALLLQAKLYSHKKVDEKQLGLYTDWPNFWFKSRKVHTGNFNVVSTPSPHPGGRYLFLDDSKRNQNFFASTGTPIPYMRANDLDNYLANELVGLLDFSNGKELKGDWEIAIKAVERKVKRTTKKFKGISRYLPILHLLRIDKKKNRKGFWFVHIQGTVPFPD
ncbi:hypothetical protein CN383_14135 [Priestia megaterium]|uniref:hypothetical protein n=1 Tax=Priestia megaterium TaxID=1404 RepID=UPI000BF6F800|nr:hypothetical protein [Priestia megaterium]PFA99863.1 hypothetical protein CN383_14135 [Priestia megaterium]